MEVRASSPSSDQLGKRVVVSDINNDPSIPMEIEVPPDEPVDFQQKIAMRRLLTPKSIEGMENWGIPPEPETECDQALQEKIAHFHQLKSKGIFFNENLLKNKAFRNPHIYNKLVEFVELDEIGSNFDRAIFDPYGFPPEAFADQLAEAQKKQAEERQQQQQQHRSQIQFVGSSSSSQGISKARHVMQSLAARAEKGSSAANVVITSATSVTSSQQTLPNVNDTATNTVITAASSRGISGA
ncbi:10952_t:CDS:2 [Acaulospora colombiana]|uniref:10952_t:CDS:1 n=1 Tax=Acaulospora colombiana TaxID=27376 RepID=A0ACA9JX02_9GLOM|nr:10952_t:CDS:2 [Acaulospora colombiana]